MTGEFRRTGLSLILMLIMSATLTACASSGGVGDLERTWQGAFIALPTPDGAVRTSASRLDLMIRRSGGAGTYPVLIHLHGCTGLGKTEREFGMAMADAGFVFIAPDSMARNFRPLQCDPKTQTGGHNRFVFDFRLSEISYALHRLRAAPWADKNNLFLMGGSEGGVAAALYRGDEFRARVIVQWTCHGAAIVRGLEAPLDSPVLAIVNRGDPWYAPGNTTGQEGNCGAFFGRRPSSRSLVLDRPGVHDVMDLPSVRNQVRDFLTGQTRAR